LILPYQLTHGWTPSTCIRSRVAAVNPQRCPLRTTSPWAAIEAHAEAEIAARLFPDQVAYRAEEQRRFALLEAHWDVPLEPLALPG